MDQDINQVRLSYGRCVASPTFFDDFYQFFQSSSPAVKDRFKNTDMVKQKDLLRHGLSHLIMFAGGSKSAEMKVEQLSTSHDKDHMNIPGWMYRNWLDALLRTVKLHDKKMTQELDAQWKSVLQLGIDKMIAAHSRTK
ncbi:hypothetical protein [Reichenbachiella ulvae]|uniref:Globin n=1 Tax=Reichenbachiella ulvae TaxID=2980104 RepID=A0ABT3CWV7_9BACT|nr:hypothetical protein [Reichenbachiella ulvae]MCV9388024.1 hypothetical protein [Reichenbachiella ulvae]